ncbi:hypothetical protein BCR41DRAFT_366274 [Lobosporangium transversale]|uniref:Aminoacyl-transfer RNA synthetases class-II family profile domain-containing protein n=1 Tax=Lobosporangium transversale TaxID=64571 RepID=A0A1Y2G0T2_9FUNG|nr:hypothetical protein BCR41DRAFT_366274 [Lobosporangium transversale]ORY88535.1 hypothetical protein BCR41DRAFT_366274 [Lobosporangium transversale]|eukprot:XP_021874997.1 hypothetical protein BCR41DRAFT_366274 [Lobosporangium transversale]
MSAMRHLLDLCKRRGFLFQSAEIHGHVDQFTDEMVDSKLSKEGAMVTRKDKEILLEVERMEKNTIVLKRDNYISRSYRPIDKVITTTLDAQKTPSSADLSTTRQLVDKTLNGTGVFINYMTVQRSHPHLKIPFGIAQIGKSFRNEIRLEHAIFRTPEFEQMELEYFVAPWQAQEQFTAWRNSGWIEVEGIANRGDFDLSKHTEATGIKLQYTDAVLMQERQAREKATGIKETSVEILERERFTPHVVESSCGLNRAMLALMLDAMEVVDEHGRAVVLGNEDEANSDSNNNTKKSIDLNNSSKGIRTIMKLHPRLAPIKVAVMPLVSNNKDLVDICSDISGQLRQELQVNVAMETQNTTIGKRYYRMDEIGTPWCSPWILIRSMTKLGVFSKNEVLEIVRDGLRLYPRKKPHP